MEFSMLQQRYLEEEDSTLDTPLMEEESEGTDIVAAILSNTFLFFLIFGLSATVNVRNLQKQLGNKFAIGCGVLMQFLIMPLLGFISVISLKGAGLTKAMGIALLVVTSSPGGSYSNWWCSMFNADLALSVAMTTVSSILSIALLPANLMLYSYLAYGNGEESILEALDFKTLFVTLGIVLTAILSGLLAGYHWDSPGFHVAANRLGSVCGLLLILFSVFLSSGGGGSDSNFWNMEWSFYVAVAFPCLIGIALANIISRAVNLSPPETVAIAIECCYQNTGIATSVAITMFDDPDERAQAVAVPLFYGVVEAVAIGIYCVLAWKWGWTKAPPDENLCIVLGKTYEVDAEDDGIDSDYCDEDAAAADASEHSRDFKDSQEEAQGVNVDSPSNGDKDCGELRSRDTTKSSSPQGGEPQQGGLWGRLVSPIRALLFGSQHHQDSSSTASGSDPSEIPKDDKKDDQDGNRNRFVSADYTAETSQCSTPDSPPQRPERDVIFNMASLTIPETSSEHFEKE